MPNDTVGPAGPRRDDRQGADQDKPKEAERQL